MAGLPSGMITFLFTDIEGSTRLWEQHPVAMQEALPRHDAILRTTFEDHGGHVFKTVGDAFCAAFAAASDAVAAAVEAQRRLHAAEWGDVDAMRVRLALHTGTAEERAGDYFGPSVNRVARLLAAGHGGQILLSLTAHEAARGGLPEVVELRDLGERRLKDLIRPEHIFQLLHPELPQEFPPLRTLDLRPNNLPAQPTPLIGREQEIATVLNPLRKPATRLMTLTGPGGTGKTRLGLQVAADVIDEFEQGVFFVALAPISDPSLVASTIAKELGVREHGGRPLLESLKEYLQSRQMLLVLDNFEQILEAAPTAAELLAAAPRLKVLVTSRAVLRLRGEQEFAVPPLPVPDLQRLPPLETLGQFAAVELFVQRARNAKPELALTQENAPAIAEICHRLDGLPLAIELAAARTRMFAPQALLSRLGNRLKLLTGGARDLPERQQTLRSAIAWSYDLLEEGEQRLFRRLSVFVGGFTLEAAEAVCDAKADLGIDVLDGVSSLAEKSLLRPEEQGDGEPRFWMLETIREFGLACLVEGGEGDAMRQQHTHFFRALVGSSDPSPARSEEETWLDRLAVEHDNLRAALDWSVAARDAEMSLGLGKNLADFWRRRYHWAEGLARLQHLMELFRASEHAALRAAIAQQAGDMAHTQGNPGAARLLTEESLELWRRVGDKAGAARALTALGNQALHQGYIVEAKTFYQESLAFYLELDNKRGIAFALNGLGNIALETGNLSAARALFEEGLFKALEAGTSGDTRVFVFLGNLGCTLYYQGDYLTARSLLEEAVSICRELDDKLGLVMSLPDLAEVARSKEDYTTAARLAEESLAIGREIGSKPRMIDAFNILGAVARCQGGIRSARSLHEESLALARDVGRPKCIASSLHLLALAVQEDGDYEAAKALHQESLTCRSELQDPLGTCRCLEGLAAIALAQGGPDRTARMLGACDSLRKAMGAPLPPADRPNQDRVIAATQTALGEESFAVLWAEGRTMTLEQSVAYALES